MNTAGWVLAGGQSRRMGRDKALLELGGQRLVDRVAAQVLAAAGDVTIIGDPERYASLGYRVVPDLRPGCGPLAGIETVLSTTEADWNLIVACDMPGVTAEFLKRLLTEATLADADCLLPRSPRGPEPLCAAYHRRCLRGVSLALSGGVRKVTDGLKELTVRWLQIGEIRDVENVNTLDDAALFFGPHVR